MQSQKLLVNGERIKELVEKFSEYGRTENNGVSRLALSKDDLLARHYFCSYCKDLGLDVTIDDLGNIYATLKGVEKKPPIVIGSHLDSVKNGGRFDGSLGVITALEVVNTLIENNIKPQIPITVANFTNEEGARFEPSMMASGILSSDLDKEVMLQVQDKSGVTFKEALHSSGYEGEKENRLKEAEAFLELHIEQGPVLERESISIGVVEGVAGMVCYDIKISGESDHAGTTPMSMRKDPLFTAAELICQIKQKLLPVDEDLMFTVGRIEASPNIHNVIPNQVVFSFEARHKDDEIINKVEEVLGSLLEEFLGKNGTELKAARLWKRKTTWFDKDLCRLLESSATTLGYTYKKMISGAGHDAQYLNRIIPSVMVFVPSKDGKSHCEKEYTAFEGCEKGANIMLETVLSILAKV